MFIEKLTISGFKSYKDHTVIDGFDRYFNAITGPNGSGKSNIFDAICFVLGIQNLSSIRASGLQDLIYKKGQSGVTKASVEIIFNNENKEGSPVGYEQYDRIKVSRQVTVGSSSKYFINDHTANATRVQNLFHSVQLNINNPHFLIMQGQIIKVLNMKPPEILGLVEEAAGIKMFEEKKEYSERTLEKKQRQLDEINRIIQEELTPNLEKLRKEKDEYDLWASLRSEVERMQRWVVAYEYKETDRILKDGVRLVHEAKEKKQKCIQKIEEQQGKIDQLKIEIRELTNKKEGSEKKEYAELENAIAKLNKEISKNQALIKQNDKEIQIHEKKKKSTQKHLDSSNASLISKQKELKEAESKGSELAKKLEEAQGNVSRIESRINEVNIGISAEGQNKSVSDEIEDQKRFINDCDVEIKRIQNNTPYLINRRNELSKQMHDAENEMNDLNAAVERCRNDLSRIDYELQQLNFNADLESQLLNRREFLHNELTKCKDKYYQLERVLGGLEFKYEASHGINKNRVYGVLVKLFQAEDKTYHLALQTTAGGKLYYIVVEDENDSSLLISYGKLSHRYNFIPLNKIDASILPKQLLDNIRKVSNGRECSLALDYIQYDKHFENAMRFAFGNTVICDDKSCAADVAFHKTTRTKAVTKDGDVYDPQGIISGGYKAQSNPEEGIIYKLSQFLQCQQDIDNIQNELTDISSKLASMENDSETFKRLLNSRDIALHQLQSAEERKSRSTHEEAYSALQKIEEEIKLNERRSNEIIDQKKEAQQKILELHEELEKWNSHKDEQLGALEMELKQAQNVLYQVKDENNTFEGNLEQLRLDIQSISQEIENAENEIKSIEENIEKITSQKTNNQENLQNLENNLKTSQAAFEELKEGILKTKDALSKLIKEENDLQKDLTNTKIELAQAENEISTCEKNQETAKGKLKQMRKDYPWIDQEERFFGVPHTDFDFKQFKPNEAREKLESLIDQQQELDSRVNKRVLSQYDRAENELNSLISKKETVEKEKEKIEAVIEELEIKKKEAITSTYHKVTQDLQDIVAQVLPELKAQLVPPEGKTIFDGLELRVAFNDLQKSLLELSGGQKSIIALGLVLALLKFKPAPIYILDEVDSALDLNHTQNIGKMLRRSFQKAQFLVVSHKEGMWNNANVVFKTSFRDSTSIVQRIENSRK